MARSSAVGRCRGCCSAAGAALFVCCCICVLRFGVGARAAAASSEEETTVHAGSEGAAELEGNFAASLIRHLQNHALCREFIRQLGLASSIHRHFLSGREYTVFVPSDAAFWSWSPVDYGFNPFSVDEFRDKVILNHFVLGRMSFENFAERNVTRETLGGEKLQIGPTSSDDCHVTKVFRKLPGCYTVNGADVIVNKETRLSGGNAFFIDQVLFLDVNVVQELRKRHGDKETAPLLTYPHIESQFLSNLFYKLGELEDMTRFRWFIETAHGAALRFRHYDSGKYYKFTVFAPTDSALRELPWSDIRTDQFDFDKVCQLLLDHTLPGYWYSSNFTGASGEASTALKSLGGKPIRVTTKNGAITVNGATVLLSDLYVYNLGNLFVVDKVLVSDEEDGEEEEKECTKSLEADTTTPTGDFQASDVEEKTEDVPEEPQEHSWLLIEGPA